MCFFAMAKILCQDRWFAGFCSQTVALLLGEGGSRCQEQGVRVQDQTDEDIFGYEPLVCVKLWEPSVGQNFILPPDRFALPMRAEMVTNAEISVGRCLNEEEVMMETIRRKQEVLRSQRREGVGPMLLHNEDFRESSKQWYSSLLGSVRAMT